MFINVITRFNDGRMPYYPGERVDAANFDPATLDAYRGYGWIAFEHQEPTEMQSGADAELTINPAASGHSSEEAR